MLGGMRANNVSLTWASTLPGEEESRARAASCNIPQVVDITNAAGIPLPVASPTTPSHTFREKVEVVEVSSHLSSRLVEGGDLPALQLGHLLGQRGMLDASCYLELLLYALACDPLLL